MLSLALLSVPRVMSAQGFLDQFSYEGLRFSGIGFEIGPVASHRVTTEVSGAVRVDYGFIAPRVRVLLGGSYFKGDLADSEIEEFQTSLQGVVIDPTGDATVDVGQITWANLEFDMDLQYVFPGSPRYMTYLGVGLGVHVRNGGGTAIDDTFVEDALDTIAAGANISFGVQIAIVDHLDFTADFRGGLTSELLLASARAGLMYRVQGRGGG
jgi:hypothetical protein